MESFSPQHEAEADDSGEITLSLNELKQINAPSEQEMAATSLSSKRSEILDFGDQGFLLHELLSAQECKHFIDEGERVSFEKIAGANDNYRSAQSEQEMAATSLSSKRSEILDFGDQGFLLHELLSAQECKHFIDEGERVSFEKIAGANDNYRSAQRITFESVPLADALWKRLRPWLSDITIDGDHKKQHIHGINFLLQGTWTPLGLNPMFRLCKYYPGGHFAPHFDGYFVKSSQERSLQTFMLYLNGDFEGGSTNFVDEKQTLYKDSDGKYCAEDENILCHIQPEPGLAIVFNHQRLHEGQKLSSGVKYILRTDIMFRNVSQNARTADEEKALELVQEAERKEAAGECMEAANLYRRAFKLSPEVAAAYGN